MRSLKNYTIDAFHLLFLMQHFLTELFPDVNAAYSDFINKLMSIINQIASFKEVCVKNRTEEWFDGEVAESIKARDKLFKKFTKSKLLLDKELFNAARNSTQSLIYKKTNYSSKKN